jgi:hypothetical protein
MRTCDMHYPSALPTASSGSARFTREKLLRISTDATLFSSFSFIFIFIFIFLSYCCHIESYRILFFKTNNDFELCCRFRVATTQGESDARHAFGSSAGRCVCGVEFGRFAIRIDFFCQRCQGQARRSRHAVALGWIGQQCKEKKTKKKQKKRKKNFFFFFFFDLSLFFFLCRRN